MTVSSDALKVITAIYQQFPERVEEIVAPKPLAEYKLGKLLATRSAQDQHTLVDFIFTVMLTNERAMRKELEETRMEIGAVKQ